MDGRGGDVCWYASSNCTCMDTCNEYTIVARTHTHQFLSLLKVHLLSSQEPYTQALCYLHASLGYLGSKRVLRVELVQSRSRQLGGSGFDLLLPLTALSCASFRLSAFSLGENVWLELQHDSLFFFDSLSLVTTGRVLLGRRDTSLRLVSFSFGRNVSSSANRWVSLRQHGGLYLLGDWSGLMAGSWLVGAG